MVQSKRCRASSARGCEKASASGLNRPVVVAGDALRGSDADSRTARMTDDLAAHYLDEARRQMRGHKRLAEGAMAQLNDEELFVTLDPESNSIAVIVKHMSGNMRSRSTDFLTPDGEKPNRYRDQECGV